MRIVVLHGQSHKGSTYHLAKLFCDKLGGEVTEFFLPRDFGAFCVGCSQCFSKSEQLKQAVCLSTAAGAGTRRTNQDLADSAFFWGIAKIHRYGRNVRAVSWEQVSQARKDRMARELSTLAKRVERGVGKVRPGLRTKAFFTLIRWMQKRGWNEADQVYWREKGWTGRARPWRKA